MAALNSLSSLSSSDHDSDIFTPLREMYKRYMLNPCVAEWLLSRQAPTDFHKVRREKSVMVSISSASPPKVIPHHTTDTPFPASCDLMFLDHVQHGFAFGHIWGNFQSDTHPYAPLAARAGASGWDHVQSRKFASDLTIDGTLEIVEYSWFTNNRAMVILSRTPYNPGMRIVRTSEIFFFSPVERNDIPPQRPALVLLLHDRSMCSTCGKEICCCPNAIGIDRATPPACRITPVRTTTSHHVEVVSTERIVQSWEDRARVVSHGNKRGLLSIVYSGSFAGNVSQITVRQAYVSVCEDQDAIGYRIQQHLAKLFSRKPPIAPNPTGESGPNVATVPPLRSAQACSVALTQDVSSQFPVGFTPKGGWYAFSRQGILQPSQDKSVCNSDKDGQGCCSNQMQTRKLTTVCRPAGRTSCAQKLQPDAPVACSTSCKRSRREQASEKERPSGSPDFLSDSGTRQNGKRKEPDALQGTLCGPEKAGTTCDCSVEKMQDRSLARILNSGTDEVVAREVEDMASLMEPIFANSPLGSNSLLQLVPRVSPRALIANMSRQEQGPIEQMPRAPTRFANESPNSTKCETTSTTLPSPLPPPPVLQVEPVQKRFKTDPLLKPDSFGFALEAGWQNSLDDRDKALPLPAWNGTGGRIERPLSALGRALGVTRSSSPFALMSANPKTPSPRAPSVGGSGFPFVKIAPAEFDFHNAFGPQPMPARVEFSKKPEDRVNLAPRASVRRLSEIHHKTSVGRSRNTGARVADSAAGSGVCCDICGITFAKRSNKIRHIQTVHNRLKQFECDLCGTKFGLKADLGRHRFRIHESRAFRCDSCGKSFAEQAQLDHHVRVTHEEDSRPWECNTCRMRFGRKSSLTRHGQTVHQQTRFVCRVCKKSYSQKFDAVRHERRVHGIHEKAESAGIKQLAG